MIPYDLLKLKLSDVLKLAKLMPERGESCSTRTITAAVKHLEAHLARKAKAKDADDRRWLAGQIMALTTELPKPAKRAKATRRRK